MNFVQLSIQLINLEQKAVAIMEEKRQTLIIEKLINQSVTKHNMKLVIKKGDLQPVDYNHEVMLKEHEDLKVRKNSCISRKIRHNSQCARWNKNLRAFKLSYHNLTPNQKKIFFVRGNVPHRVKKLMKEYY